MRYRDLQHIELFPEIESEFLENEVEAEFIETTGAASLGNGFHLCLRWTNQRDPDGSVEAQSALS